MVLAVSLLLAGIGLLILVMLAVIRWPLRRKPAINLEKWPTVGDIESLQLSLEETGADLSTKETIVNWVESDIVTEVMDQEDIISLYVLAPKGSEFHGKALLEILLDQELSFNDMKIFHYLPPGYTTPWFRVACATEPGTFDAPTVGALHCNGLCLFLQLTGDAKFDMLKFQQMVAVAENIASALSGQLYDQYEQPLTPTTYLQLERLIEAQNPKAAVASEPL